MKLIGKEPTFTIKAGTPQAEAALAALWVLYSSHGCAEIVKEIEQKAKAFEEYQDAE